MKRRRVISVLAIMAIVAVVVVVFATRDKEPRFEGRQLSAWLAIYREHVYTQDSSDFEKAQEAVQAIGTNALPCLLKWIRHEPPSWQSMAFAMPRWIPQRNELISFIIYRPETRADAALTGFHILGSNAVFAIPELRGMMRDRTNAQTADRAVVAMSHLEKPGFENMIGALADTNHPKRSSIAYCLLRMAHDIGTNNCVPPLLAALSDADGAVRVCASRVLEHIAPEVLTNAVPQ